MPYGGGHFHVPNEQGSKDGFRSDTNEIEFGKHIFIFWFRFEYDYGSYQIRIQNE